MKRCLTSLGQCKLEQLWEHFRLRKFAKIRSLPLSSVGHILNSWVRSIWLKNSKAGSQEGKKKKERKKQTASPKHRAPRLICPWRNNVRPLFKTHGKKSVYMLGWKRGAERIDFKAYSFFKVFKIFSSFIEILSRFHIFKFKGYSLMIWCMYMNWSEVKVTQSCPTICNPMKYTVHGIVQTECLSG